MLNRKNLDNLYNRYNRREYVEPDPLQFLYAYHDVKDREITGIICSSLAYGRVAQIIKSIKIVLKEMTDSPYEFLMNSKSNDLLHHYKDFKHRFTTGEELCDLLKSIKTVIQKYGSIENCIYEGFKNNGRMLNNALDFFVKEMKFNRKNSLIPDPSKKSACKRLFLFTRWMIREDDVDPGGWKKIPKKHLIVPLDVHMHKISLSLNITKRSQADLKTAIEVTEAFKKVCPDDPIKYDFCLTRFGIRNEMNYNDLIKEYYE